jgi:acyl-CoA thioesterase-1
VRFSAAHLRLVVDRSLPALREFASLRARLLQILLLVIVQTMPVHAQGGVILVLGDSLSSAYGLDVAAGWVQLLQNRLDEQDAAYRVVNASISGDTTNGGVARLSSALKKHAPDVVVVELGGNDGLRGLPLTVTRANLERIIVASQTSGARVLLLGMRLPPNFGPAYNDAFHAIYEQLAEQYQVGRVPFLLAGVGGVDELMQLDRIHPRAEAQGILLDNVWPHLQPLL